MGEPDPLKRPYFGTLEKPNWRGKNSRIYLNCAERKQLLTWLAML